MLNVFQARSLHEKPLPRKSNLINYSLFKTLDSWIDFRSFSIKYVAVGQEIYTVNDHVYEVSAGQYILANEYASGKVKIDSPTWVRGICIDVAPDLVSEAIGSCLRPDTSVADPDLDRFFNSPDYFDALYHAGQTETGKIIRQLERVVTDNPDCFQDLLPDLYFNLADALVQDHIPVYKALQKIPSVKSQTAKDLLRRVSKAKTIIENHPNLALGVDDLAKQVLMSTYHFHRVFKNVFGISPYQYSLQIRLQHAHRLILEKKVSLTEAALATGFSELSAFTKTYRKYFSHSSPL